MLTVSHRLIGVGEMVGGEINGCIICLSIILFKTLGSTGDVRYWCEKNQFIGRSKTFLYLLLLNILLIIQPNLNHRKLSNGLNVFFWCIPHTLSEQNGQDVTGAECL